MTKTIIIVLVIGLLILLGGITWATNANQTKLLLAKADQGSKPPQSAGTPASGRDNCGWTNMKFAEFLGGKYGITPTGASDKEKYQALSNALSQKGITYFTTAGANDKLSCCGAADALYAVSGAKEKAGSCDVKIHYLVQNGLLKMSGAGDPCSALCNIEDVFGGPEKFGPPRNPPPTHPPGHDPERPSSRI